MDVEPSTAPKPRRLPYNNPACFRSRLCCTVCLTLLSLIFFIIIVLVILSCTLYKAKHPVTTVDSVSVRSFDFSLLRLSLNLSLDLDLSVHNPNRVGFKYRNSTALLNFNGQLIGQVPIPAGWIDARDTNGMNLTLTIFADRLLSNSQAYADVLAGSLPLNSQTRMAGKVTVFSFIKVNVVSTTSCNFDMFTSNRTIGNQQLNKRFVLLYGGLNLMACIITASILLFFFAML